MTLNPLRGRGNRDLESARLWFKENGMMPNPKKYQAIVLGRKGCDINFQCANETIPTFFFDSIVTLLVGPNILHVKTLAHPGRSTWSRQENQSMCKHSCQLLVQAKGLTPFS